MTTKDGRLCHSCVSLQKANKELTEEIARKDAHISGLEASFSGLMASYKSLLKTHNEFVSAISPSIGSTLVRQTPDAYSSRRSSASVTSETISTSALVGVGALTLSSGSSTPQQTSDANKKRKTASTPPKKTPKAVTFYHQCVLCGWHAKASNKNMGRHFRDNHNNYAYNFREDAKHYFYMVVDAPYAIWPVTVSKPWESPQLVGVNGVSAQWLNEGTGLSRGVKSKPTNTKEREKKTPKSKEFVESSDSEEDDFIEVPDAPTASDHLNLSDSSDADDD
jgi:hypothetical protein